MSEWIGVLVGGRGKGRGGSLLKREVERSVGRGVLRRWRGRETGGGRGGAGLRRLEVTR